MQTDYVMDRVSLAVIQVFSRNMKRITAFALIAPTFSGIAGAETQIDACTTISAPGHYVLNKSITNLKNISYAPKYINWTWNDPKDGDFAKVMVYINGKFRTNVSKGVRYYNATNLIQNASYRIGTHTVDTSGNINRTWVNHTARTALGGGS